MKVSPDLFDSNNGFFYPNENRLQKAYQLQTDLEEAKGHEIMKMKNSLEAIQLKVEETYALLTKERESDSKEAIEETSAINAERERGTLLDTNDKLQKEVEELTWFLQLEKGLKADLEEAKEKEILKLQNSLKLMHAKADETNALLIKERESSKKIINKLSTEVEELKKSLLESERNRGNESEKKSSKALETSENKRQKIEERPQKSLNEKQQECQDLLNRCLTLDLGFSEGRPVAACIIYKCLTQWRSFEVEKTSIYDCIIQTIGQAIETQDNNNEVVAYWLSNASTLLQLFQHTLEQQDEANCPTFLFKQQLTAYVEKMYGMLCDNLKEEILPLLKLCIEAPKLSRINLPTGTDASHWQGIVNKMDSFLNMLKSNNVPPFLVCKIFMRIFSFINVQLFNSILVKKECCTFSNGEYVKAGLSELENWCYKATEKYAGSAWDELKHTREAVGFLVIHQKPKMTLHELTHDLCPILNILQLHRISTKYWDDKYNTHSVSPDVFSKMKVHIEEDTYEWGRSSSYFLLDDNLSIPLPIEDLSKSMDEIDIEDIELPPLAYL